MGIIEPAYRNILSRKRVSGAHRDQAMFASNWFVNAPITEDNRRKIGRQCRAPARDRAMTGTRKSYVDVSGGQMHVRCIAAHAPTVVFLHQTASSGEMWAKVMGG